MGCVSAWGGGPAVCLHTDMCLQDMGPSIKDTIWKGFWSA